MIKAWTDKGRLLASTRKDGNLIITDLGEAEYAAFGHSPDLIDGMKGAPDFKGWYKYTFTDYDTRKLLCSGRRDLFESDVTPVRRYISDHDVVVDPPTRCYLDIETDSRVKPVQAIEGDARLLSFACVGDDGKQLALVLEDDDDQAEAELTAEMWRFMGQYDQIPAWYGDGFDFLHLRERGRILAKRFKKIMQPFWEHCRRLLFIDHLAAFKRHHMAAGSGDEKTSYALGSVCMALIGEGKEIADEKLHALIGSKSMGASTWKLWEAGGYYRQKLLEYNLQDTALLPKLEAKTGYLALQQDLAELSFTFADSHGLKPSPQVDGFILRMAREWETHLVSKHENGVSEQYEGAEVQKPTALGVHRNVHVCDFKSLYPTIIRSFNISPEMKGPGIQTCRAFGKDIEFDCAFEGMFPALCRAGMAGRDKYKKLYKADPNNLEAERKSKAFKIFVNSAYGVLGNPYFRFYDVELAESITLSAQYLNRLVSDYAISLGYKCIYKDTDSVFVTGCNREEFKDFVSHCNKVIIPAELEKRGCNPAMICIETDYEKEFELLVFPLSKEGTPAAKRYFGKYAHYGFKPKDDPEIRGLEYMRTDGTRYARRLQKQLIDIILSGQTDPEFFHEWARHERTKFFECEIDPDDIMGSSSISKDLDAYKANTPSLRVARIMEERGEDVSEGTRVQFIIVDGRCSPKKIIPAADYVGECDRYAYWQKIYSALIGVLAGAMPDQNWKRWSAKYPKVKVLPGQLSLLT